MDILNVQSLISQQKIVGSGDIDPDNSYLVVGVWQDGNRKSGSANNAYPSYVIPVTDIIKVAVDNVTITGNGTLLNPLVAVTPTLQKVLDFNHDLSVGRNFQGTGAGDLSGGCSHVNFFGTNAGGLTFGGINNNFLGFYAGYQSVGANFCNFFGYEAGRSNSGNHVTAFGFNVARANNKSNQFIISNLSISVYAGLAAATTALSGGSPGSTYLWIDSTDGNTVKAFKIP